MQENSSPFQSIPPQPGTQNVPPQPMPTTPIPPTPPQPTPSPMPAAPIQQTPTITPQPTIASQPQQLPNSPQPTTTTTAKPFYQKPTLVGVLIALILILLLAAGFILFAKYSDTLTNTQEEVVDVNVPDVLPPVQPGEINIVTPTQGVEVSPIETITTTTPAVNSGDLKTYTDQQNKFSIEYPSDSTLETNRGTIGVGQANQGPVLFNVSKWGPTQSADSEFFDGYNLSIAKVPLAGKSLQEIATAHINETTTEFGGEALQPLTPMNISGKQGVTYKLKALGEYTHILLPNDAETFYLVNYSTPDPTNQGYEQTVLQMLFSLKFL